jgi:hypothetical protein
MPGVGRRPPSVFHVESFTVYNLCLTNSLAGPILVAKQFPVLQAEPASLAGYVVLARGDRAILQSGPVPRPPPPQK